MSTRRHPDGAFDHGAQSFTARDSEFLAQVKTWETAQRVAPWPGRLATFDGAWRSAPTQETRWVATPSMNALPKHLLQGLNLKTQVRVTSIQRTGERWQANTENAEVGQYDKVILTSPAPQARDILGPEHPFDAALSRVQYAPCWAAMAHGAAGLDVDGVRITHGPLAWVGRQDSLPGRTPGERWILHASATWSIEHLEKDKAWVASALGEAFQALSGVPWPQLSVHRWRYSLVEHAMARPHLHDQGLYYAGDGCLGGRVETAWLSGVSAARALLGQVNRA
jgi:predicted NAD/FAD-dependent oxidoreductase